jgi:hypothetical protein
MSRSNGTTPIRSDDTTHRYHEDETSVQRGGSARLWTRNHLVDVVGEIAQPKSGSIPRPVATCRNGRYFYRMCQDQRRSDGRSCLNFSRFHFSSLSSQLRPPFRDARRRSNRSRRTPSPNEIDFGLSVNIDRRCAGCRLTFKISDAFQRLGPQCSQVYRV